MCIMLTHLSVSHNLIFFEDLLHGIHDLLERGCKAETSIFPCLTRDALLSKTIQ